MKMSNSVLAVGAVAAGLYLLTRKPPSTPPPLAQLVSIDISGNATMVAGTTQQLTAIGTYSDGSTKDITRSGQQDPYGVAWLSSNTEVLTLGLSTGLVTATGEGLAQAIAAAALPEGGIIEKRMIITVTNAAPPIAQQLEDILPLLRCVYGTPEGEPWPSQDPPAEWWDQYGLYATNQRLQILVDGKGYWVNVGAPCLFPTGIVLEPSYVEDVPANLVGWTNGPCSPDSGTIADQVASIIDYVEAVWGYRNGAWAAPTAMQMFYGYYIAVAQACTLSYGGWNYPLLAGWNLIGWRGNKA